MRDCDAVITCLPSPAASAAVMRRDAARGDPGQDLDGDVHHRRGRGQTPRRAMVIAAGRRGGGLPGLGRLPPRGDRQHRHLRRLRPRHIRAHPAACSPPWAAASCTPARSAPPRCSRCITNYLATATSRRQCRGPGDGQGQRASTSATAYEAHPDQLGHQLRAAMSPKARSSSTAARDISFTMDLVRKDVGPVSAGRRPRNGVPLEISPLIDADLRRRASRAYGPRELSPNIIRRLEDATGLVHPARPASRPEMTDDEPEEPGYEVIPQGK